MSRLEKLRKKVEDAFVDGKPEALELSQKLDRMILAEQKKINLLKTNKSA